MTSSIGPSRLRQDRYTRAVSRSSDSYVFSDAQSARELARLRQIEAVFDPASQRLLRQSGLARGLRCLEVGAGAGSIARWMVAEVGPEGRVVAMDINTRCLQPLQDDLFELLEQDIQEYEAPSLYDLIHARYVLIHISDPQRALDRMVRALAPGGWLVVEEPDFFAARAASGPAELMAAFDRVNVAIHRMFAARGLDPGFGLHLPGKVEQQALTLAHVENDAPLVPGGSAVALMMRASAEQLASKYEATGAASAEDVAAYCRFAELQRAWGIYYGTVRVCAQKPAESTA